MPIWFLENGHSMFFALWDLLERYKIKKIVVWYPSRQIDIQKLIDKFVVSISTICKDIPIVKVNEDYSSVQAAAIDWSFDKVRWKEDTLAAMQIMENYMLWLRQRIVNDEL